MKLTNLKDIQAVISSLILKKIDEKQVVNMTWATNEVLNKYSDVNGSDVDFYLICAKHYINDYVKRCITKFEPSADNASGQLVLDGFTHLQKAYPVQREGERELVPTSQLSDSELEVRAQEYEIMATGCIAHAEEIRQYVRKRNQRKAA